MTKPSRMLKDFPPEVLQSLLETLESKCPPVLFDGEDLTSPVVQRDLQHRAGRRSVYIDVQNALRASEVRAAKVAEITAQIGGVQ